MSNEQKIRCGGCSEMKRNLKECSSCDVWFCKDCTLKCEVCRKFRTKCCFVKCGHCQRQACVKKCGFECEKCGQNFCRDHKSECKKCNEFICGSCTNCDDEEDTIYCDDCYDEKRESQKKTIIVPLKSEAKMDLKTKERLEEKGEKSKDKRKIFLNKRRNL